MFSSVPSIPARPSPGFWISEGLAPGLTLAGFAPPRPGELEPAEVHELRRCGVGRLLRWVFPADIEDAP